MVVLTHRFKLLSFFHLYYKHQFLLSTVQTFWHLQTSTWHEAMLALAGGDSGRGAPTTGSSRDITPKFFSKLKCPYIHFDAFINRRTNEQTACIAVLFCCWSWVGQGWKWEGITTMRFVGLLEFRGSARHCLMTSKLYQIPQTSGNGSFLFYLSL